MKPSSERTPLHYEGGTYIRVDMETSPDTKGDLCTGCAFVTGENTHMETCSLRDPCHCGSEEVYRRVDPLYLDLLKVKETTDENKDKRTG